MVAQQVEEFEDRLGASSASYEVEWICAEGLEIDHSYQRKKLRRAWVKEIASTFDPDLLQPLRVNRRHWDGERLFVMDGQHRLMAIRLLGWHDQKLPCIVYDNLPYEVEAKLFDTQGYSRPLTPAERFKSELARHMPEAEIIDGTVRKAGFQINYEDGELDGGRIPAVQTLRRILRRYRSGMLGETLSVIAEGFGSDYGPRQNLIEGVAAFLARYASDPGYDRRRLVRKLRETTATASLAKGAEITGAMGCSPGDGVAAGIHHAYNYRLGERGLPEYAFGRPKRS